LGDEGKGRHREEKLKSLKKGQLRTRKGLFERVKESSRGEWVKGGPVIWQTKSVFSCRKEGSEKLENKTGHYTQGKIGVWMWHNHGSFEGGGDRITM